MKRVNETKIIQILKEAEGDITVYPVSAMWTKEPDCLRDSFSSSFTLRGNDDDKQ